MTAAPEEKPMPYGPYDTLLAEVEDEILTLTLNRPAKLNAYTRTMSLELRDAFERAAHDDAVRAIIVTGAGRAFCAGVDISGGSDGLAPVAQARLGGAETRPQNRFVDAILNCGKPTIAAINGHAVGVGITMTLPMDVRILASEAKIGFPFVRRGLVLEAGSAWFLPRIVGLPTALRWCLEGKMLESAEAAAANLVSEVVAPSDVVSRAREVAKAMTYGTAPVAVALTRHLLYRFGGEVDPTGTLEIDALLNGELGASADAREGIDAFRENRTPVFPGRASTDMPPAWCRPVGATPS